MGTLVGNIRGLGCVLVEGKVIGNINAESLTVTETGQAGMLHAFGGY